MRVHVHRVFPDVVMTDKKRLLCEARDAKVAKEIVYRWNLIERRKHGQ